MKTILAISVSAAVTFAGGVTGGWAQPFLPPAPGPASAPKPAPVPAPPAALVRPATLAPGAPPVAAAIPVSQTTTGPRIQFDEPNFDFGKVKSGETVKHTFVFTNMGDQVLELSEVRPSCGCTAAGEWSRKVEPGRTGTIPIQFSSANFSGPVAKSVAVTCNDPTRQSHSLQIKGTVWKPIDVTPTYVFFNPFVETPSNETRTVRIVNHTDEIITLSPPECTQRAFKTEIKTLQPGKEFELLITALAPYSNSPIAGAITVKTSSTNMPVITLTASLMPQQAVSVLPTQVMLPPGPLRTLMRPTVSVRNNGTNILVLSEPKVNAPGVDVLLQTVMSNRVYSLAMTFPAGYQVPPGEKVELTVKSTHPQYPVIKVPVYQSSAPAIRPAPTFLGPQPLPPRPGTNARPVATTKLTK